MEADASTSDSCSMRDDSKMVRGGMGGMGGIPNAQEAQLICMELARRMEDSLVSSIFCKASSQHCKLDVHVKLISMFQSFSVVIFSFHLADYQF